MRDDLLVEIQTQSFSALKQKLITLTEYHPVRLVYPIASERWIIKMAEDGKRQISRRKSPKRGSIEQLFAELVSFPGLLASEHFSLDVLFIQEEEVSHHEAGRSWRRKGWIIDERRLLKVVDQRRFCEPADFRDTIPTSLADPFTTAALASAIPGGRRLARQMAYCLREMGLIDPIGKRGNAILYTRSAGF